MLELGVGRDEVEIDVLSKGRAGILGIGSEPAKVRVALITSGDSNAAAGLAVVSDILKALGVEARPTIRSSGNSDEPAIIDIQGDDAGLIIGHRGETLRSLQFITNMILSHQQGRSSNVVVDVERYRDRRVRQLQTLARRTADRVASTGRPATLEPMPPADRRIVHMALADHSGVSTESSGEGSQRHITIRPTGAGGWSSAGTDRSNRANGRRRSARSEQG